MGKINRTHRLNNGLVLLAEEMPWSNSVAMTILIPCGTIHDPALLSGLSGLTCELALRGTESYNNREFLQVFENLGVESTENVSQSYTVFSAAMLSDKLHSVLPLYAELLRHPRFPEEEFESAKQVMLQELYAVEDEPSRKMMIELGKNFFPEPWGRPSFGDEAGMEAITLDDVRKHHQTHYQPDGTIVSVAGNFDWESLKDRIEQLFGDWAAIGPAEIPETDRQCLYKHLAYDSSQTHIGLAYPSVPFRHQDYLLAWSGVGALSGGMSCRLFTEVREKRGLCYSVYASYYSHRDHGAVFCYCGSRSNLAQESLNVILEELEKLSRLGITSEELKRLKIRAKSSLVMQQESTLTRTGAIARDWYHLGRIRSMEEIDQAISSLSLDTINTYLYDHPASPFRIVTLGESPLNVPTPLLG